MTDLARAPAPGSSHRLIASRYPTVGVFDDLTRDADELRVAFILESLTNDRLAHRIGLLPHDEIVSGPTASMVMAAFLHADAAGGRFTDGSLGAWYASFDVATAIAETVHHSLRRLRLSAGAFPTTIQMRELIARIAGDLIDIRGLGATRPDLYDPTDYRASQAMGVALRNCGEPGILYDSVRRSGGHNACVYRPSGIALPISQGDHYEYLWDGAGALTVFKLTNVKTAPRP